MQQTNSSIHSLKQLGLNQLEAEVYLHLLKSDPMTAYRIGKSIHKPTANIYKAIESLAAKGAVLVESNKSKSCKAVPPDEFLALYERNLLEKTKETRSLLQNLDKNSYDEKTYSIDSVPLVFERFRAMMQKVKLIAVIDIFPNALDKVVDSIQSTIDRGVAVYIQVYTPIEIEGAHIAYSEIAKKAISHWKSEQLNLVIDGEEYLTALMNAKLTRTIQANWSNNYYMACTMHAGLIQGQTLIKITNLVGEKNFEESVKDLLNKQKYFYNSDIIGFTKLLNSK